MIFNSGISSAQALQRSFVRLGQDPKVAISSMVNDDQVQSDRFLVPPDGAISPRTPLWRSGAVVVPLLVVQVVYNTSTPVVDHSLIYFHFGIDKNMEFHDPQEETESRTSNCPMVIGR